MKGKKLNVSNFHIVNILPKKYYLLLCVVGSSNRSSVISIQGLAPCGLQSIVHCDFAVCLQCADSRSQSSRSVHITGPSWQRWYQYWLYHNWYSRWFSPLGRSIFLSYLSIWLYLWKYIGFFPPIFQCLTAINCNLSRAFKHYVSCCRSLLQQYHFCFYCIGVIWFDFTRT